MNYSENTKKAKSFLLCLDSQIDLAYYMTNDVTSYDELREAIENDNGFDVEICYYSTAIQYLKDYIDLNRRETFIFLPLISGTIAIGLYPEIFLNSMHMSVNMLVEIIRIRKL